MDIWCFVAYPTIDDGRCAQLTKEQLLAVLPLLIKHLTSENYVAYTYAAITIDRILFIKRGTQLLSVAVALFQRTYSRLPSLVGSHKQTYTTSQPTC